ncbi:MAG: recombination protein RecO [Campylobacter sp.]|nr:recombination protein RecO [Campylobacter sp.]MBR0071750.1 recombination protein RecO [Campylobacter sp.]
MQGYILKITKVKEEDCIVDILTRESLVKAYRFYGARHSNITQGYKIDFELISNMNFLPQLRGALHLGFEWLTQREKLLFWQQFIRLFHAHLKDAEFIDEFYFNLLENAAVKFGKQNPKRIIIESYLQILEFEGRLHSEPICFICDDEITDFIALGRAFLPAHEYCVNQNGFNLNQLKELFSTKKTTNLDDEMINSLYNIVLQGF